MAFTILGCTKRSFQPILVSWFLLSICFMRSINQCDLPLFQGMMSFLIFSSLKYQLMDLYLRPWSKKGNSPLKARRQTTTPKEKTSILDVPSLSYGISGAIQIGVPFTERLCLASGSEISLDSPKSAILKSPLWIRMFQGLMSRWISRLSQRTLYPSQNCLRKNHIFYQGTSYLQSKRYFSRLPPLQYSMMRQRFFQLEICIFLQFTKFG